MKKSKFLFVLSLLVASSAFAVDAPIRELTPGSVRTVDPNEVCSTADRKISTKDVRNVSAATKKKVFALYGITGNHTGYCNVASGCEVDHLISLELGGSNDVSNLWPQPYTGVWNAHMKNALENKLHRMVCVTHELTLMEAQMEIAVDWKAAWIKYVNRGKPR